MKCDGACTEHKGEVKPVYVRYWGNFFYCEEAIEEDTRRGLEVEIRSTPDLVLKFDVNSISI